MPPHQRCPPHPPSLLPHLHQPLCVGHSHERVLRARAVLDCVFGDPVNGLEAMVEVAKQHDLLIVRLARAEVKLAQGQRVLHHCSSASTGGDHIYYYLHWFVHLFHTPYQNLGRKSLNPTPSLKKNWSAQVHRDLSLCYSGPLPTSIVIGNRRNIQIIHQALGDPASCMMTIDEAV